MLRDGKHIDKAGIVKLRKAGRYLLSAFQGCDCSWKSQMNNEWVSVLSKILRLDGGT